MVGINVQIMPYELSDRAWKWYCNSDVFIKAYGDDEIFVINGVRYDSYKEVLDKIESMAEEFEKIEQICSECGISYLHQDSITKSDTQL